MTDAPRRLDPPDHYDDERRAIWAEVIARLKATGRIFTTAPHPGQPPDQRGPNRDLIDTYVEAIRSHRQASRILGSTAVLIQRDGRAVENPALAVQRRSAQAVAALSTRLGLDRDPIGLPDVPDRSGGARWCDTHDRYECIHHRRRCKCPTTAVPPPAEGCCHESAIAGTPSCWHHAGKSRVKAKEEGQAHLARLFAAPPADVTAPAALLAEVRRSAGLVSAYGALLAGLEDTEGGAGPESAMWWGTVRETRVDGSVTVRESKATPHVILAAYNAERDRLVRACAAAISAGAQAAAVDMAKEIAGGLSRLLDAIFGGILVVPPELQALPGAAELVAWQHGKIPDVVPAAIRAWDPAEAPAG